MSVNGAFAGNLEFKNLAKPLHFVSRNTDFRIERLPGRISMDLAALSGLNLVGPITLTTKSKDVKLEEFTQSLTLDLERGDIELRPHGLPLIEDRRPLPEQREYRSGACPPAAKFDLTASTDKGEARNDFGSAVSVETEGRSAKMKASVSGGTPILLSTARGTVTVRKE